MPFMGMWSDRPAARPNSGEKTNKQGSANINDKGSDRKAPIGDLHGKLIQRVAQTTTKRTAKTYPKKMHQVNQLSPSV